MKNQSAARPRELNVRAYLIQQKKKIDAHLDRFLPSGNAHPAVVHQAMRYSIFAGGKRIRPALVLATGEALDGDFECLIHLACAVEMIHAYSLVHDDLPAMDNDDFRRGQPTVHRKFGEATAILAGNGLLTLAFQVLAETSGQKASQQARLQVIHQICRAVGTEGGLIGGQVVDLLTEGKEFTRSQLEYIHSAKTGALFKACTETAAIISNASAEVCRKMARFGANIGLAFQVVDDILDVEGTQRELGKRSGKDQAGQKATYPALHGLEASRQIAQDLVRQAEAELDFLGDKGHTLRQLARFISLRKN